MSKLAAWIFAVLAVLAGLGGTLAAAFSRGKSAGKGQAASESQAGQARHEATVREVAQGVSDDVDKLPDAPAQQVDAADAGTAAGQLREHGWLRD